MKRKWAIIILFLNCFLSTQAQQLWEIKPKTIDYMDVDNDTSVAHLKEMMSQTNSKRYFGPATLLAYYHSETERDFILDTLRIYVDTNSNKFSWHRYYNCQRIRGYLGDSGAIAGMDTIVRFSGNIYYQAKAIGLLGRLGYLNYFDTLVTALSQRRNPRFMIIDNFSYYGQNEQFHEQCKTILSTIILDTSEGKANINRAIQSLNTFDSSYAYQIIKMSFLFSNSDDRFFYFNYLGKYERDSLPERSMEAIQQAVNETERGLYIPFYSSITSGKFSTNYLKPKFINFCKDWYLQDTSVIVRYMIRRLLKEFIPIAPKQTTSLLDMLDSLISEKQQCATYDWLSDSNFINELDSLLDNARGYLLQSDSNNCYRQLKLFQMKVDEEYHDSVDGDTKRVNTEAWKFLYYNAQYILDRFTSLK